MIFQRLLWASLFLPALLSFSRAEGQRIGTTATGPVDSTRKPPKRSVLKKNYFVSQFPQEFCYVQCGLQDKTGRMWFGTAGNGIYTFDGEGFTNFTRKDGLCHNDILCATEDRNGNIWFGTRNGLIRYRPAASVTEKGDFTNLLISEHVVDMAGQPVPYDYKPADNFVWSILQDRSGKLWFGTNKGVFTCSPPSTGQLAAPVFTNFLDDPRVVNTDSLRLAPVCSMVQDKRGDIWFVSNLINYLSANAEQEGEGICRYDGKNLRHYKPDGYGAFRSIAECSDGRLLFLNSFHGVYSYDGKSFSNLSRPLHLDHDTVVSMLADKAGNIWLGKNSDLMENGGEGGVWRYDGKSLRLFTIKDGLSHNSVFCIVEDRKHGIWFGTRNTGLCRLEGSTFTDYTDRQRPPQ